MPKIESWFPEIIYKEENIIDDIYNERIKKECFNIQKKVESNTSFYCEIYNTHDVYDVMQNKIFNKLITVISQHVNNLASIYHSDWTYKCGGGWINISQKGNYQEQHIHPYSFFSAVYYPLVPDNSGDIIFKSPYANMVPVKNITEYNEYNYSTCSYKVKAKDLLIFRSHMPHLVQSNKSNDPRISIAMNFI